MGMAWDPTLEVGNEEIDDQHREIFRRYGELVDALARGDDAELGALFEFLGEYAVEHFAAEERVMGACGYPGANVHAAAHARFVREYGELVELWRANGATIGVAVKARTWIGDWLRAHISGVDLALARYLRGRATPAKTPTAA
jgi:hemerythrin